jgi:N utilization substance protein B
MRRKLAREMAMKLIFQMDIHDDYSDFMIDKYLEALPQEDQTNYIQMVVCNFIHHKDEVDSSIEQHSKAWKLNRMAKIDLAILRVAVTEIYFHEDIPEGVSINEAVEMAKIYSTQQSSRFINGILGSIVEKK